MIREATVEDLDCLADLGEQMHAESRYSVYDFDKAKLRHYLNTCITYPDGMVFVFERDNEIIGGVVGWMSEHYFGNDKLLCDLGLFVKSDKRGALAGAMLIKKFLEYGKENGAAQIVLSNSTNVDRERVAKLYEKMGMEQVGFVYSLDCKSKGETSSPL